MDLKQKAEKFGFTSKIRLVHENLKSPDMGELELSLLYLWMCELQKWLRENKKISVDAYTELTLENKFRFGCDMIATFDLAEDLSTLNLGNKFTTYEEALETGLQEALKLIK